MNDETNFFSARAFVAFGMQQRALGKRESASGPGSSLGAARDALNFLKSVIANRPILRLLDLGCGDWNWMRHLGLPHIQTSGGAKRVDYEGWEADESLVGELTTRFGQPAIRFLHKDICEDVYPVCDLVILRDVLFHLPIPLACRVVERVRASGCRYLLATSFEGVKENVGIERYLPIPNWGFYRINLGISPFNLREFVIEAAEETECAHQGHRRSICLYEF